MSDRGIIVGDVLHVLKTGFVYERAVQSTRRGFWRYSIESKSPNSQHREIRLVVIPSMRPQCLKLVTVMWVDER